MCTSFYISLFLSSFLSIYLCSRRRSFVVPAPRVEMYTYLSIYLSIYGYIPRYLYIDRYEVRWIKIQMYMRGITR